MKINRIMKTWQRINELTTSPVHLLHKRCKLPCELFAVLSVALFSWLLCLGWDPVFGFLTIDIDSD